MHPLEKVCRVPHCKAQRGERCRSKAGTEWSELQYHENRHSYDDYPCGYCKVPRGERCIRKNGSRRPYPNTVHVGRYPPWPG